MKTINLRTQAPIQSEPPLSPEEQLPNTPEQVADSTPPRRYRFVWIVGIASLWLLVPLVADGLYCQNNSAPAKPAANNSAKSAGETASRVAIGPVDAETGVTPLVSHSARPRGQGACDEGNRSSKGDVLVQMDDSQAKSNVQAAEADLKAAKADLEIAKIAYTTRQSCFRAKTYRKQRYLPPPS